jgi:hypothetical protein
MARRYKKRGFGWRHGSARSDRRRRGKRGGLAGGGAGVATARERSAAPRNARRIGGAEARGAIGGGDETRAGGGESSEERRRRHRARGKARAVGGESDETDVSVPRSPSQGATRKRPTGRFRGRGWIEPSGEPPCSTDRQPRAPASRREDRYRPFGCLGGAPQPPNGLGECPLLRAPAPFRGRASRHRNRPRPVRASDARGNVWLLSCATMDVLRESRGEERPAHERGTKGGQRRGRAWIPDVAQRFTLSGTRRPNSRKLRSGAHRPEAPVPRNWKAWLPGGDRTTDLGGAHTFAYACARALDPACPPRGSCST